jgi:hypothetical protein
MPDDEKLEVDPVGSKAHRSAEITTFDAKLFPALGLEPTLGVSGQPG